MFRPLLEKPVNEESPATLVSSSLSQCLPPFGLDYPESRSMAEAKALKRGTIPDPRQVALRFERKSIFVRAFQ